MILHSNRAQGTKWHICTNKESHKELNKKEIHKELNKKQVNVQNSLMDSVGEGEDGKIWENDIETCKISCKK